MNNTRPTATNKGGQHAAPGFFGLPGERHPRYQADRLAIPTREEARAIRERADRVATEQTRAFRASLAARYPATAAAVLTDREPATQAAAEVAEFVVVTLERAAAFPVCVPLRADQFADFARQAEIEQRPVEDLLQEVLSQAANLLRQGHLASVYGDPEPPAPAFTTAMRLARHWEEEAELAQYREEQVSAYEFYHPAGCEVEVAID